MRTLLVCQQTLLAAAAMTAALSAQASDFRYQTASKGLVVSGTASPGPGSPSTPASPTTPSEPATPTPPAPPVLTSSFVLSPASLAFEPVQTGEVSPAQSVQLTNTGEASLSSPQFGTHPDVNLAPGSCVGTLAPQASCVFHVAVDPAQEGPFDITFNVQAGQVQQQLKLTGSAAAPSASLSTQNLDFGTVTLGTTSSSKSAVLMNTGKGPIALQAPTVTGPFEASHSCETSLAAGDGCFANVTFKPTAPGAAQGTLTFASSAGEYAVALAGNAAAGVIAAGNSRTWVDGAVARNCLEYLKGDGQAHHVYWGATGNGVYRIDPDGAGGTAPVDVHCDMTTDGGGWTVVQRRVNGSVDFYRTYAEYAAGFGSGEEYWIGNDRLAALTATKGLSLRIDLARSTGETAYALYNEFRVAPAFDGYRLAVTWVGGTAGNALGYHSGFQFSAKDVDQDIWGDNCAGVFKGAWWYGECHNSNLNAAYLNGPHTSYADGMEWAAWTGQYESMARTEMKVR